jgi:hypothetical protein
MSADSVIAKAVGLMLQRGVSSADAIEAAAKLQRIAKIGAPVVVEMHGLKITLNGGGVRRRQMHRPGRIG